MKLRTYLKKKKLTQKQFADIIGVSEQSVRNWVSGFRKPSRHLMAILEETKGKVTANDFFGGEDD
jgi:transcriptional regulator with XRE-family HTH domain